MKTCEGQYGHRVGIFGHTGMVGSEIESLLDGHGGVSVVYRENSRGAGGSLSDCAVVFLATKDAESMGIAPRALAAGVRVIDMSGAFRIGCSEFEQWYGLAHAAPQLIGKAVYGLPAAYADAIAGAELVAVPGCYPTAVILALRPLAGLVRGEAVVFATSGNSGARRTVEAEPNEISYAYGTLHKHVPEMHKYTGFDIDFNPVVLRSVFRGINATIRIALSDELSRASAPAAVKKLEDAIGAAYAGDDLVKVVCDTDARQYGTADVVGTNAMLVKIRVDNGRAYITRFDDLKKTLQTAADTFGIVSVSPVVKLASQPDVILKYLETIKPCGTFKVEVKRADKNFPHTSAEFAAIAGAVIMKAAGAKVDIHNPQTVISIDIREGTYVYSEVVAGVGGLPVGTAGRALVMLSGGIDSPVAAFLAAKRGLAPAYIHFASPPFTSEFALEKVRDLARKLEPFVGQAKLHIVSFTEIQEAIRDKCNPEYMITIMRRFMVRIAEGFAKQNKLDCIITGESLSQVASQTVAGITSNNVCARVLPILRPLVTYDKHEIIDIARRIGTYEISCRPYPDCCTVFVPKHPSISPRLENVAKEEAKLDVEALTDKAISTISM